MIELLIGFCIGYYITGLLLFVIRAIDEEAWGYEDFVITVVVIAFAGFLWPWWWHEEVKA